MTIKKGDRIECLAMPQDSQPIPTGTKGTVTFVNDVDFGRGDRFTQVGVKWDNGRSLMLCTPPDMFRIVKE